MKMNKHLKQVGEAKDRGMIKWQGMMLTEHVRLIEEWREEDNRVPMPELDEWDLQAIQEELELSMKRKCEVQIQIWIDWKFHYHTGIIEGMDLKNRSITYSDSSGLHRLPVDRIISISQMN